MVQNIIATKNDSRFAGRPSKRGILVFYVFSSNKKALKSLVFDVQLMG